MSWLILLTGLLVAIFANFASWIDTLPLICAVFGGYGGLLYCVRGLYINICAKQIWDRKWVLWYFLRPIVSIISGFVSFVFLKAGLLILETNATPNPNSYVFVALSFVAGLNVDNFIQKLEEVSEVVFGIKKSRIALDKTIKN